MPSRRSVLAAAALLTAGCSGQRSEPAPSADASGDAAGSSGAPTADVAAVTDWRFDTDHESIGLLALGGGPDTPVIYVGRGADPTAGDGDQSTDDTADTAVDAGYPLYALGLDEGGERWRTSLPNPVQAQPVYGDGDDGTARVYVVTGRRNPRSDGFALHALDPTSGDQRWTVAAADGRSLHLLATTADTVFVGQRADQRDQPEQAVIALDAADGTERWRVESGAVARSPDAHAFRRDTLFVTTQDRLRALDPGSGEERWQVDAVDLSGPAFGSRSKRVVVGSGTALRALALADGSELWRRDLGFEIGDVSTPPEATSSTVFVDAPDGRLLAVNPVDGGNLWSYSGTAERAAPTVERTSDSLYVGAGGVHAINPVSGQQRWSFTPAVEGAVVVRASTTVFASAPDAGRLWALDPRLGEQRWAVAPGAGFAGPANAGDLAVIGVDGTVYALDGTAAP